MTYKIVIKRQAKNKLQSLPRNDRVRITEKIVSLEHNPDEPTLDIKPLIGESYYRLRVGNWRVIFLRKDDVKIITIEKIKPRGDAYK
jgi:mRNA interferase RelE/StbE